MKVLPCVYEDFLQIIVLINISARKMKVPLAFRQFEGRDLEGNLNLGPEMLRTEFQCYGTEYPKLLGGVSCPLQPL